MDIIFVRWTGCERTDETDYLNGTGSTCIVYNFLKKYGFVNVITSISFSMFFIFHSGNTIKR